MFFVFQQYLKIKALKFIKFNTLLFIGFIIILSCNALFSQVDTSLFKNRISFELGGPLGYYSLNFERRVYEKRKRFLSMAVGVSAIPSSDPYYGSKRFSPRLSFQIKDNIKFKKNYFEYGLALTNYYWTYSLIHNFDESSLAIFPILGYSRDISNKFNLGLYFTPLVYDDGYDFTAWGAVRLGYQLN